MTYVFTVATLFKTHPNLFTLYEFVFKHKQRLFQDNWLLVHLKFA